MIQLYATLASKVYWRYIESARTRHRIMWTDTFSLTKREDPILYMPFWEWQMGYMNPVWQCALSINHFEFCGWYRSFIISPHILLPAIILAISVLKFIPIPQKNDNLGATSSTFRLATSTEILTYSSPSSMVNANSKAASAPASCMWYPDTLNELNMGMLTEA